MVAAAGGVTVEVQPSISPTWYITYATGQRGGPFTEDEVKSMIARQQIKITDSIAAQGSATWVPITQSPFAPSIVTQASMDRLAASTCPRCGAAMVAVLKQSMTPRLCIIFGVLCCFSLILIPVGIILIIVGLAKSRNRSVFYQCPRCNYRS